MAKKNITVESLGSMKPKARWRFFHKATPQQIESLTEPCCGEAHSNPYIDHCGVCLNVTWGRMLKLTQEELAS